LAHVNAATVSYRYAILGSGRQGTAAAYDFAMHGDADSILMGDLNRSAADSAARRVNRLMGEKVAYATKVDAKKPESVLRFLKGVDVVLSAVPYSFNLSLSRLAVKAKASMVDLGGHTGIVRKQLKLDSHARKAGIAIVPDCGMGPGANITLAVRAIQMLDKAEEVRIYDGGLPLSPRPPWNYSLFFSVGGLTNEYSGTATFLRGGKMVEVPALTEQEEIMVPSLGILEARVTTGGLSTMPWTYDGTLRVLENKTLRYPGHWSRMEAFADLGMFSEKPVKIGKSRVVPREVFHELFEARASDPEARDVAVIHVVGRGLKDGVPSSAVVNLTDRYDEKTGFRAMERLTGGHAAIVAAMIARGTIQPGAHSVESAVPPEEFIHEARRRGMEVTEKVEGIRA
jgi:lysine 6-dehydrogenase